ncbi:site-specific DNA-methyltransferase [Altererythrobacter sp. KTW20L]|uniref:site-specific DNA-methyltransferase n=1 Tax=Altererythrobacter sp. KTW20L TaxID=2942210 RepID=UPI0020BFD33B|nr:DNA methyltransferase [Altererythrobacter sp. KTW20L]MCL6250290.1 site-specific DNA-methyltransferase [Altererythrobacter sp. KTW20L]
MTASTNRKKTPSRKLAVPDLGPIEQIPPELLRPYARNARTHSERQVALIGQSIETFGFTNPIIADEDGTIIAGHGRWEAARLLGLTTVPVLRSRHMTPEKVKAYRIADNKLAELSGWDIDLLKLEFDELSAIELEFSIEVTGFAHPEIDMIVDEPATARGPDDGPRDPLDADIPEPPVNPVSQMGDLWLMDGHRLLVGSSLDHEYFTVLMAGHQATMVFQDGPYNVPIKGHVSGLGKVQHREFAMASGEMSKAQFQAFNASNLKAIAPHLVDGAILAMCMDWRGSLPLQLAMEEAGLDLINLAVWVKSNGGMGSLLRSQHELVFIAKHGKASHINNVQLGKFKRYRTNVWRYPGVNTFGRGRMEQLTAHPTPKPVPLVADAIRDVSNRGQIVLDSFMGSGTTLLAAERTGRIAYGMDIDPGYVDVSVARWEAMTGKSAVLESTGKTFAETSSERAPTSLDNKSRA